MPLNFAGTAAGFGLINAIVPYSVPPNTVQQLIVQQGTAYSVPMSVVIAAVQPGVYVKNGNGIIVVYRHGVTPFLASPSQPATAGDTVVIYSTGLGAVAPAVTAGTATPLSPLSRTTNPVTVTIGGQSATVSFAGLTPTSAGLYNVNAVVPSGITPGPSIPVVLTVAGISSPPVTLAIQ